MAMNVELRPVRFTPEVHVISSFWKEPAAPVGVHMNTMVLTGREPVVFDTGVDADRSRWLDAVTSVVDADDVRWIVLSHDDHDHVGNLEVALDAFPNATVVASWFVAERLTGSIDLDPRRQRWVGDGETLDIGDRTLVFERPPLYDSPTTRGVFDPSTGLYWGGDLGVALGPVPVYDAAEIGRAALGQIFLTAHQWNSPWFAMLDDRRYQGAVNRLASLGITMWASAHGPAYRGAMVEHALDLLRRVPTATPVPQPGQAELEAILGSMLALV
jgi:flavorubredoxin